MIIYDRVYGKHTIEEPVLLELIDSFEMQRLKHVSQFGTPDKYHNKTNFSRYEHSLGVMLLLKIKGAGLEEQVAGLLHDASHSSFSHIADWIFADGSNGIADFQDDQHISYLRRSELANILENHHYTVPSIGHNPKHLLLEKDLPDICADRLDYTLREIFLNNPATDLSPILDNLIKTDGGFCFSSKSAALAFAEKYHYLQDTHWASRESMAEYELLSAAFRRALDLKMISRDDFWNINETALLAILESSKDEHISYCINQLATKSLKLMQQKIAYKKVRVVDPPILIEGKVVKLSEIDSKFQRTLAQLIRDGSQIVIL